MEYESDTLARIYVGDARATFENGLFKNYVYYLQDHLLSTRVVFEDDGNGAASLVSEAHSYPFGLQLKGDFTVDNKVKRLYNFKEQVHDFGLGWMDFGARYYTNGDVPVFLGVDPISDKFAHLSTFNYASNNPIVNIDFHGLQGVNSNTGEIQETKSGIVEITIGGGLEDRIIRPAYDPIFPLPTLGLIEVQPTTANVLINDAINTVEVVESVAGLAGITKAAAKGIGRFIKRLFKRNKVRTRKTRAGNKGMRETRSDGSVIDITDDRVKEFLPEPRNPNTGLRPKKFDNDNLPKGSEIVPGSKGKKRTPTKKELRKLRKSKDDN